MNESQGKVRRDDALCCDGWKKGCSMLRVVKRPALQQQREGNKREGWSEGNREEGGRMRG